MAGQLKPHISQTYESLSIPSANAQRQISALQQHQTISLRLTISFFFFPHHGATQLYYKASSRLFSPSPLLGISKPNSVVALFLQGEYSSTGCCCWFRCICCASMRGHTTRLCDFHTCFFGSHCKYT